MTPSQIESRKRKHAKQKARAEERYRALEASGSCCRNCAFRSGGACDLKSDFHGVVRVTPDHLCAKWSAA